MKNHKLRTKITIAVVIFAAIALPMAYFGSDHIRSLLVRLFGPPRVVMAEIYDNAPGSPEFDHTAFGELLQQYVDASGLVDYAGLSENASQLDAYIASLARAPFEELGRDQKLALLINAYNAFTLRLILDHYPIDSITDIPDEERWDHQRWNVGGHTWSLNQIENEQIRPNFVEPRIHFALVCAAIGCPPLRREAYNAASLESQLAEQTSLVHTNERWLRYDAEENVLHLTQLYSWYGDDFAQVAGSVLEYVASQSEPVRAATDGDGAPRIDWLDYDWSLNVSP